MVGICPICGLPEDLCACEEITRDEARIVIRLERRRWNRPTTIIDGLDPKRNDLHRLAQELKSNLACGGSVKNGQIILQGDHREDALEYLVRLGFNRDSIEVQ